eukprot:15328476-Alexandrium_andersonii.AAC.1
MVPPRSRPSPARKRLEGRPQVRHVGRQEQHVVPLGLQPDLRGRGRESLARRGTPSSVFCTCKTPCRTVSTTSTTSTRTCGMFRICGGIPGQPRSAGWPAC